MSARAAASIASGGQVRTEIVDDAAGFQELEPLWRRLERESTARSPCQRWDWARLWWRHYAGRGDRPWIVLVRLDDEIVGLGPLYVRDAGRRWGRRLRFIATGEPEESEVASEFLDVLAAPAHRALAGRAVAAAIARSDQWREMELRNVLESSTIATHRDAAGPQVGQRSRGLRYTVRLDESWDAYLSRLSSRFRTRVRAEVRAFEEGRQALVESQSSNHEAVFELMVDLHQRHWQGRGRPGAFVTEVFRDFHRDLIALWSPTREALLRTLQAGSEVVGVLYNFRWLGLEAYYQSGIVPGHPHSASPGLASHVGAIRQARAEGLDAYDFMMGKVGSYKAAYACDAAPVSDLVWDRRGRIGRIVDRGLARLRRG